MTKPRFPNPHKPHEKDKRTPPKEGSFIAYKKVYIDKVLRSGHKTTSMGLATLEIPASAKRTRGWLNYRNGSGDRDNTKCRASKAKVLGITEIHSGKSVKTARSTWTKKFVYTVGKTVKPNKYGKIPSIICTGGIHFFMHKTNAIKY